MTNTALDLDSLTLDIWAALHAGGVTVSSPQVRAALPAFLNQLATTTPDGPVEGPRRVLNGDGTTKHTCTPDGKALPFGRKAPAGECARCDELRAGAAPRADHAAGRRRADHQGYPTDAEWAAHRASCTACQTGGVCTAGQW